MIKTEAQARRYLEQALAIFEERLGPQHPDTVLTRRTLVALDDSHTSDEPGS